MFRRKHALASIAAAGLVLATTAACSSSSSGGTNDPVTLDIVVGVTGGQAPSAAMWIAGVNQAVKEVNAAGGILGHPIQTNTLDTRSDPAESVAQMKKALNDKPYAVLGTILSGATLANMQTLQDAGVPQFTGSVSPAISDKHPTSLFRLEPNSNMEAQMFANWMVDQANAKNVAFIFANDEYGTSGEQSFANLVKSKGANVVAEVSTAVGQTDFSGDIAQIKQANPDTVFMYMHETETGRFLQQAQTAGLMDSMRFLGASSALAASTVQLAGPAAEGVEGFVPYSASAPGMDTLTKAFEDANNGAAPDHNYFKGYVAVWSIVYGTQDVGSLDQAGLIKDLHSKVFCVNKYPNLLSNTKWDANGDIDRSTFVVKISNGSQQMVDTIKPLDSTVDSSC